MYSKKADNGVWNDLSRTKSWTVHSLFYHHWICRAVFSYFLQSGCFFPILKILHFEDALACTILILILMTIFAVKSTSKQTKTPKPNI